MAARSLGNISSQPLLTRNIGRLALIMNASLARMFCRVGSKISDIETPALLIDLEKLEKNLKKLPETLKGIRVNVRPHAKAHKCPTIGSMQVSHGAVGLCCQKLSEAESMVYGGIKDVLISNEVVGRSKLLRLASLAKQAKVSVCVDSRLNAQEMSEAAETIGANIVVIAEVNVGQDRCGVEPGEPVVELAKEIQKLPCLHFKGIQAYQGWNQHVRKYSERKDAVGKVVEKVKETISALFASNIPCEVVTGGGTGTYMFEATSGVYTEVQPGSYIFMDADYNKNLGEDDAYCKDFEQSLFVISTVVSVSQGNRAVVDAGMKAVSLDSGVPLVLDKPDISYQSGGDEHGILKPPSHLKVGDQVWLVPGHCDPTVNLYDWVYGVRNGLVEAVYPITARGPGI